MDVTHQDQLPYRGRNRRLGRRQFLAVLAGGLLAACQGPAATHTPLPAPTLTSSPRPTEMHTATALPSSTPQPTETPTAVSTPTLEPTATFTPEPTATVEATPEIVELLPSGIPEKGMLKDLPKVEVALADLKNYVDGVSLLFPVNSENGTYGGIIKSCGLARMRKEVYPWGDHTPIRQEAVERIRHGQGYHK